MFLLSSSRWRQSLTWSFAGIRRGNTWFQGLGQLESKVGEAEFVVMLLDPNTEEAEMAHPPKDRKL